MVVDSFIAKIKYAKKYLLGKEFFKEHFDAAIDILSIMASDKSTSNFVILDAPTQSGKTSVMEMIYRILNFEKTFERYGIEQVIYMTADNGSGDGSLKLQTYGRFRKHWKNYIHELPIDFLKRSDFDKFNHVLNNTLIMVDESQYGWREITSKGQKFLQIGGVNFCTVEEMKEKNMYIVSVSATTQNERYGDNVKKLKQVVTLKTGEGYAGIDDFMRNGIIKPLTKDEFIDSYDKLDLFLKNQRKKLDKAYKETNVAKCVIMRLLDNKRKNFITNSNEFEEIVDRNGFSLKLVTCNDSKIDYAALQSNIFYYCNNCFKDNDNKYLLIVIKYAFSYGITIDAEVKKLIATCYDVRKCTYSTEATVQGLPGRMSGYGVNIEDLKDLNIYINETHYKGIKANIDGINEYVIPLKTIPSKVKCSAKQWDGSEDNIVIWNNEERKPLAFEGEIVDKWVKNNFKKLNLLPLFGEENLMPNRSSSYLKNLAVNFLKYVGVYDKMGFNEYLFDTRRQKKEKDQRANAMCTNNPLLTNGCRTAWRTVKNANNNTLCWAALFDISNVNKKTFKGLKIKIPYGKVGFATIGDKTTSVKIPLFSGYNTSNKTIVAQKSYV